MLPIESHDFDALDALAATCNSTGGARLPQLDSHPAYEYDDGVGVYYRRAITSAAVGRKRVTGKRASGATASSANAPNGGAGASVGGMADSDCVQVLSDTPKRDEGVEPSLWQASWLAEASGCAAVSPPNANWLIQWPTVRR